MKLTLNFFLLILFSTHIVGQDVLFYNTYHSQLYYNPAFAGSNEASAINYSYRNQWPELSGNYQTHFLEANQVLSKGHGLGISYLHDNSANTLFRNEFQISYAKSFSINEKSMLSFGTRMGIIHKKLDYSNLIFGDQIDPRQGFVYNTSDPIAESVNAYDISFGALYYNKRWYVCASGLHLNTPNTSLTGGNAPLPVLINGELGYKWEIKSFNLIPFARVFSQGTFNSYWTGVKLRYKKVQASFIFQNESSFIYGLRYCGEIFSIGYHFNYFDSPLFTTTHELGLGLNLNPFNKTNNLPFNF